MVAQKHYDISEKLVNLTDFQVEIITKIIDQLQCKKSFWRNPQSDLITRQVLEDFGDALRIHHVFSAEALSKDRFEYTLERVLVGCGIPACRAPKGNPGHDLTIKNTRVSLKTQADKNIKIGSIHISKFMELGKGAWTDKIEDIQGLLLRFLEHMKKYQRIFTLRRLRDVHNEVYELVEIPKLLLEKAQYGKISIMDNSKQTPKPAYCNVYEENTLEFRLYFDGGTERKLQIKDLKKDLCMVHATWCFPRQQADKIPTFEDDPVL